MSDRPDPEAPTTPLPVRPLGRAPVIVHRTSARKWRWGAVGTVVVIGVVLAAGAYQGWFSPSGAPGLPGTCPTGITLQGEGASFLFPLESVWNSAYRSASSNEVNYNDAGAGAGISALSVPSVDFAATDEPLSAAEYQAMPGTVLTLPVTAGAIAIIYNLPGLTQPIQLTGSVLAEIYLGSVTSWNSSAIQRLNPGVPLPSRAIVTVHRSDAAGTTYVLTNYLAEDSATWSAGPGEGIDLSWPGTPDQQAEQGNSKLVQYVQSTADTIGYADLTDVLDAPGLQYAKMENPSGTFVLPTLSDTSSAISDLSRNTTFPSAASPWTNVSMVNSPGSGDYPLATFSYFLVFQHASLGFQPSLAKTQALVQWLDWVVTDGQNDSAALYYVPIPSALATLDEAALGTITFDGTSPSCTPR